MLQALTSTLTCRGLAASFLGSVTLNTPFLNSAPMFSVSKLLGTEKLRTKAAVVALDAVIALGGVLLSKLRSPEMVSVWFSRGRRCPSGRHPANRFQNQFVFGLVNIDRRRPGRLVWVRQHPEKASRTGADWLTGRSD